MTNDARSANDSEANDSEASTDPSLRYAQPVLKCNEWIQDDNWSPCVIVSSQLGVFLKAQTIQQFNASTIQRFNNSTVQQFNSSTVQRFNDSTIQRFNSSTVRQFNASTVQRFNNSTLQQFNDSTVQRFNNSTLQRFIASAVNLHTNNALRFFFRFSEKFFSKNFDLNKKEFVSLPSQTGKTRIAGSWKLEAGREERRGGFF